jgi:4-hydroxy-3-polyprenylbenzoate decarboxylase
MLLPKVPLDTLDFTSFKMNLGSKMILDATKKNRARTRFHVSKKTEHFISQLSEHDRRIIGTNLIEDVLLLVKVNHDGGAVLKRLLKSPVIDEIKLLAVVSADVDIHRQESYIWGIFTRFDCERDVQFREQKLIGISPSYRGTLGIDATWKPGYPDPLIMDEKVVKLVDQRWDEYWK